MTVLLHANPDVFPADPPRDPDDAAVIAEHDWAAFSQVTVMTNHWDRPGWTDETRAYYWLLTITDEAFVAHAQQCQRAVRDLGFDEIDQRRFHLTLGRIGLVEEVSTPQLRSLAETVAAKAPPAFDITAIPLTASRGAVRYSVAPWTPLVSLHAHLAASAKKVGLRPMRSSGVLRPHIGIGYCNRAIPASAVRATITPTRALPPVPVRVDRVRLVELRREGRAYAWNVEHDVVLSG